MSDVEILLGAEYFHQIFCAALDSGRVINQYVTDKGTLVIPKPSWTRIIEGSTADIDVAFRFKITTWDLIGLSIEFVEDNQNISLRQSPTSRPSRPLQG